MVNSLFEYFRPKTYSPNPDLYTYHLTDSRGYSRRVHLRIEPMVRVFFLWM